MPSAKHDLTMDKAMGLIFFFLLFNVAYIAFTLASYRVLTRFGMTRLEILLQYKHPSNQTEPARIKLPCQHDSVQFGFLFSMCPLDIVSK